MFTVHRVSTSKKDSLEPLGTKRKFWFAGEQGKRILFKAEDRGTGDDWAEKVACELCRLLGLPHIHYELAIESEGDVPGVICENCAEPPTELVLGNVLLLALDPNYPAEEARRYKVREHTVDAVTDILERLETPPAAWDEGIPSGIHSAVDVFVGYVMLDAWIANQDRHHENWGALWNGTTLFLAPTFDHAASMARNLTDKEREERLTTTDRGYQVRAFARRATSAFYASAEAEKSMTTFEAWRAFAAKSPEAAAIWSAQLCATSPDDIQDILEEVPVGRLSEIGRRFTRELLVENRRRLLDGDQS